MVQSDIIVRKATLEDLEYKASAYLTVNDAYRSKGGWTTEEDIVSGPRCTEEDIEKFIRENGNPNTLLFAIKQTNEGSSVVGTVQIQPCEDHENEAEIGLFSVSPFEQSRGIGGKLMQAAMNEMKELGFTHAVLHVLENRPDILAWYRKLGFVETGERLPFQWPEKLKIKDLHFLVMKKPLA
ncbi:hypothetical protein RMATCC62417_10526 [Rhizopus microsporus]|nr:hypothetical protein RMATCC62417_10526 [Rhizopus microsporus]